MLKRMFAVLALAAVAAGGCDEDEARVDTADLRTTAPSSETFREAVDAVLPAVVYVEVEAARARGRRALPFPPAPGRDPSDPVIGEGSGVIFSSDGYILTSNHVVRSAERLMVTLHDRRQFEARVVARDPSTDVAIVKVDAEGLPTATFGDSEAVKTGDWVLAVGSPLGLLFTATAGIVSAKGRQLGIIGAGDREPGGPREPGAPGTPGGPGGPGGSGAAPAQAPGQQPGAGPEAAPLEHFIQTDAAINPGNSGGPLINLAGRVIGINTAIVSPTGVFAGIGFAVPINLARAVAQDLIEYGEVRRPFLGVVLENVNAADSEIYGLPSTSGAEIVSVQRGSPAEEAGLEVGDVVVAVDGVDVTTVGDLQAALAKMEPGATAVLEIFRDGRRGRVRVELGVIRSGVVPAPEAEPDAEPSPSREPMRLGFAITEREGDVFVATVTPTSPALEAGVRAGQRLLAVNGRPVRSVEDFAAAVREIESGVVSLTIADPRLGRTIINYELPE